MDFKEKEFMDEMVQTHTGLVKTIAVKLSYIYNEDVEDLIQIGFMGLIKAIRRFEPERGLAFSTYAVPVITGEIKSQLRDQGFVKVSRSLKSDGMMIKKAEDAFILCNGRSPKLSELAQETGLSAERVSEALSAMDAMKNTEELENIDLWTNEEEGNIIKMDMIKAINNLPERDRKVIMLRYYKDLTQQQVADVMGLTQVQVCRIEKKSLKNLEENVKD